MCCNNNHSKLSYVLMNERRDSVLLRGRGRRGAGPGSPAPRSHRHRGTGRPSRGGRAAGFRGHRPVVDDVMTMCICHDIVTLCICHVHLSCQAVANTGTTDVLQTPTLKFNGTPAQQPWG